MYVFYQSVPSSNDRPINVLRIRRDNSALKVSFELLWWRLEILSEQSHFFPIYNSFWSTIISSLRLPAKVHRAFFDCGWWERFGLYTHYLLASKGFAGWQRSQKWEVASRSKGGGGEQLTGIFLSKNLFPKNAKFVAESPRFKNTASTKRFFRFFGFAQSQRRDDIICLWGLMHYRNRRTRRMTRSSPKARNELTVPLSLMP